MRGMEWRDKTNGYCAYYWSATVWQGNSRCALADELSNDTKLKIYLSMYYLRDTINVLLLLVVRSLVDDFISIIIIALAPQLPQTDDDRPAGENNYIDINAVTLGDYF